MVERALSFGTVAAAYERYRPGYPDALVDLVLGYGDAPIRTAVEIGAGTGKATRAFAARGVEVTATEPDASMLAELHAHVPTSVTVVQAALESLRLPGPYDLVFAAASLHWTDPAGRWERIAGLLRPGGVFASFGGQFQLEDPATDEAVRVARAPYLTDDGVPSPDGTQADSPMQWPGTELLGSALFGDVRQEVVERRVELSAVEYVGHLSTVSAYIGLTDTDRQQALERILGVLPARVTLDADIVVHLARRSRAA